MRRLLPPLVAAALVLAPTAAAAQWIATAGGGASIAASTVTEMSGFAAACASDTSVQLTWNASPDEFMEGYEIIRTNQGDGSTFQIVLARTVFSHIDVIDAPNGNRFDTYSYTIRAGSRQHSWTTTTLAAPDSVTFRAPNKGGCSTG